MNENTVKVAYIVMVGVVTVSFLKIVNKCIIK